LILAANTGDNAFVKSLLDRKAQVNTERGCNVLGKFDAEVFEHSRTGVRESSGRRR